MLLLVAILSASCRRDPSSQPPPEPSATTRPSSQLPETDEVASSPIHSADAGALADARPPAPEPLLPVQALPPTTDWTGPFFTITFSSAGIYSKPALQRPLKIGFARSGGRLPVRPDKVTGEDCSAGWYEVVGGGFICSKFGTTNSESRQARLTTKEPDLTAVLPYPYARNAKNGTPLYRSVPSEAQMHKYEPYLRPEPQNADAGMAWWQKDDARLQAMQLKRLEEEADGVLERRMVKGFYVAVDRQFEWSGRTWYKTTKGMVGPKDRFWSVEGSEFRGVQLAEERTLPQAWIYGYRKTRPRYQFDEEKGKMVQQGKGKRLEAIALTSNRKTLSGRTYLETQEGYWLRAAHVRVAQLPPIPADVDPQEHWIDVNLDTQTLVAFIGKRPVYATLVSSGKESKTKKKDHRTPTGQWNIREKHITTTMDGDGSAAGDLPYSIEDVPYAMYFHGSYALHGAFWHRNYGSRMSHGCINLAPVDARYLFFFTGPHTGKGWHGAWASAEAPGSRIVMRDPTP